MEIGNDFGRRYLMQREEKWKVAAEYRVEMGGWHRERVKIEGFRGNIFKIYII